MRRWGEDIASAGAGRCLRRVAIGLISRLAAKIVDWPLDSLKSTDWPFLVKSLNFTKIRKIVYFGYFGLGFSCKIAKM